MFYWVVGLVGGFCAQNMYSKDDYTCIKNIIFSVWVSFGYKCYDFRKTGS